MKATAAPVARAVVRLVAVGVQAPRTEPVAEAGAERNIAGVLAASADITTATLTQSPAIQDRRAKAAAEAMVPKEAATLQVPAVAEAAVATTVAAAAVPALPIILAAMQAEAAAEARLTSSAAPRTSVCGEGGKSRRVTG